MSTNNAFDILIIGGGTAGITVAAQLTKKVSALKIAIVEPSEKHYYQPLWTLVGGGAATFEETERDEKNLIPHGVEWIKDSAASFEPESNSVTLATNTKVTYKYMVVCPGIQIDWNKIEGLEGNMGKNGICSNYSKDHVNKTWENIKNLTKGTAIFTYPNTPIKCGGAPQKIMYLAEHYFQKNHVRNNINVMFASAGAGIFGVKKYKAALEKVIESRGINSMYHQNLFKVDAENKIAYFKNMEDESIQEVKYDMLHIAPPMSSPDFIKNSPLSNDDGWVDVDKHTMRHNKYKNIFSLGDASSLPTSKTGAAVRKQAPVLVSHLIADINNQVSSRSYDGYTSCPLVTGYGKLILAEFDYDGNPAETFPFDQSKERLSMYILKKYALPVLYWEGMLKGRA